MISRKVNYYKSKSCVFARYDDMADLVVQTQRSPYAKAYRKGTPVKWAGGTYNDFLEGAAGMPNNYTERADRYLTRFTNVAMETLGIDMDYNPTHGVLDMDAYMAGEPDCLYGNTYTESDSAPVRMYIDQWISSTVHPTAIEMRGIAMLALLQAVSLHRPVSMDMVLCNRYTPTGTDIIQTVPAPTAPMNVSLASWMVASPVFVRQGIMSMTYHHGGSKRDCGIPMISAGRPWQSTQLGEWLAEQDGVQDFVFLPMMFDNGGWKNEEYAIRWIKDNLKRLLGDAYVEAD